MARSVNLGPKAVGDPYSNPLNVGSLTLQDAEPPLTAQPPAAPQGENLTQVATPDLQAGMHADQLEGQQASPMAPAPEPAAGAAEKPAATPQSNYQAMTADEAMKLLEMHGDAVRRRADDLYRQGGVGWFHSAEEQTNARRQAAEQARQELSPEIAKILMGSQVQGAKLQQGERKLDTQSDLAKATIELKARQGDLASARIVQLGKMAEARLMDSDTKRAKQEIYAQVAPIFANAQNQMAKAKGMDSLTQFLEGVGKGTFDTGAYSNLMGAFPQAAQKVAEYFGGAPNPALAARQQGTQMAEGILGSAPNQPSPLPVTSPFPDRSGVPAEVANAVRNARMRPIGAPGGQQFPGPPSAGGVQNILRASAPQNGPPTTTVMGAPETPKGAKPQPVTQGLNQQANEAEMVTRITRAQEAKGLPVWDQATARAKAQEAVSLLARQPQPVGSPDGAQDPDWKKAYWMVHGKLPGGVANAR